MFRTSFTLLGFALRVVLALILICLFTFSGFVVYMGSQPMQQDGADGMTYWQFMRERIRVIRVLPANCLTRKVE
jgi:hypothetical protein